VVAQAPSLLVYKPAHTAANKLLFIRCWLLLAHARARSLSLCINMEYRTLGKTGLRVSVLGFVGSSTSSSTMIAIAIATDWAMCAALVARRSAPCTATRFRTTRLRLSCVRRSISVSTTLTCRHSMA